jgi:HK97 family phage major capsid protein
MSLMTFKTEAAKHGAENIPTSHTALATMSANQLTALRAEVINAAHAINDQLDDKTPEARMKVLDKSHDAAMRLIDSIDAQLTDLENESRSAEEARVARRPITPAVSRPDGEEVTERTDTWLDQNGKEVRALAPGDAVATGKAEVRFGDAVRALVTGARTDAEKRALSEGTGSAGGFTVPTPLAVEFIDKLRARTNVIRAGARTVPMDSETLMMAKLTGDPAAAWKPENDAITASDATFGRVQFQSKTLIGMVRMSRELAEDSINLAPMIENAFAQSLAVELDRACLFGSGSGSEPLGLVGTTGINEVDMGTNGAAITNYAPLLDAVYELEADNVDGVSGAIMNPRTWRTISGFVDADGNPLTMPQTIGQVPMLRSTSVPVDETQGTANDASSIIMGRFSDMLIGLRTSFRLEVSREVLAQNHQVLVVAHLRADMQLAHPESFCRIKGITPA